MSIDDRVFKNMPEKQLRAELARLQKVASEASAVIASLKTELFHRAIEEPTDG